MALINCVDCGKECSTEAAYCLNCGRPIKANLPLISRDEQDIDENESITEEASKGLSNGAIALLIAGGVMLICIFAYSSQPKLRSANLNVSNSQSNNLTPKTGNSSPSASVVVPTPSPIAQAEIDKKLQDGKRVYSQIKGSTGLPVMFGYRARDIKICVTNGAWAKVSLESQKNLSYYLNELVKEIRVNPEPVVASWTKYYRSTEGIEPGMEYDGLTKSEYLGAVRNLCFTCWSVVTGTSKKDGFYDDAIVLRGGEYILN